MANPQDKVTELQKTRIKDTSERARLWESFLQSNPRRVVHALSLGCTDQPNFWGDTLDDFHPALAAVDGAAIRKDYSWERLVDAGVAVMLCGNVISDKMKHHLQSRPSGSSNLQNPHSTFFEPLLVLAHSVYGFIDPPNDTDKKVISALTTYWSTMVVRLLRDPEHSLGAEELYSYERVTPAQIFGRTGLIDPSFKSILNNEGDYTVSLISLYWTRATRDTAVDTILNAITLSKIIDDEVSPLSAFIRIMQGAGSVRLFISALASHFDFYDGALAFIDIELLGSLWRIASRGKHPIYSELLVANRDSAPLWTSIFSFLRRIVLREGRPSLGSKDSDAEFISMICPLTYHLVHTIEHCKNNCSEREVIELVDRWVTSGLFDALDAIIYFCASQTPTLSDEFLKVLSRIFFTIGTILQDGTTLVPVLRFQLPRAFWLRALVDLSSRATNTPLPPVRYVWGPDLPCWRLFRSIEDACILRDDCTRRGCGRKRIAQCKACKRAGYCGVNCQESDWQEHKRICKLILE